MVLNREPSAESRLCRGSARRAERPSARDPRRIARLVVFSRCAQNGRKIDLSRWRIFFSALSVQQKGEPTAGQSSSQSNRGRARTAYLKRNEDHSSKDCVCVLYVSPCQGKNEPSERREPFSPSFPREKKATYTNLIPHFCLALLQLGFVNPVNKLC